LHRDLRHIWLAHLSEARGLGLFEDAQALGLLGGGQRRGVGAGQPRQGRAGHRGRFGGGRGLAHGPWGWLAG
jgi:hypothetical protein